MMMSIETYMLYIKIYTTQYIVVTDLRIVCVYDKISFLSCCSVPYNIYNMQVPLLDFAIQQENWELAALLLVYGMLKVKHDRKEAQGRTQRQSECPQARVLQPGS